MYVIYGFMEKAKSILTALQGLGFACWSFDILSPILIDIQQTAKELNMLS